MLWRKTIVKLGIDLGGTNLRVALLDAKGRVHQRAGVAVGEPRGLAEVIRLIRVLAAPLLQSETIETVGVGVPGMIDAARGVVLASPHFPAWKNAPVRELLRRQLKRPVALDNDAHCAALGEQWHGAGQRLDSFLLLTLGTGIGGAWVLDRKLWRGDFGGAGEVGHMTIQTEGPRCACGNRGCWELFASASAVKTFFGKKRVDLEFLPQGHPFWKFFGKHLGVGIASLVLASGVHSVLIGGGLSKAWGAFAPAMQQELKKRIYGPAAKQLKVCRTRLGTDAGLIGAACLVAGKGI